MTLLHQLQTIASGYHWNEDALVAADLLDEHGYHALASRLREPDNSMWRQIILVPTIFNFAGIYPHL